MKPDGGKYKSEILSLDKQSKYYVVISSKVGYGELLTKENIITRWKLDSGIKSRSGLFDANVFKCSWGPVSLGSRDDVAYEIPSSILKKGIVIEFDCDNELKKQIIGVNIIQTSVHK